MLKINKYCYLLRLVGLDFITLPTLKMHCQTHIKFVSFRIQNFPKRPLVAARSEAEAVATLQRHPWNFVNILSHISTGKNLRA
jgi:hypothetical protein